MPTPLSALSPLDGRYHKQLAPLAEYCSEAALIRYRVRVEIEWLIALAGGAALYLLTLLVNTLAALASMQCVIRSAKAVPENSASEECAICKSH